MSKSTKYTDQLSAEQLIRHIAFDYVELSHDKVLWQRNDHMKICKEWLLANISPEKQTPITESDLDF